MLYSKSLSDCYLLRMVLFPHLQVNGDSDFVTGDFNVFEFDSGNWDQQDAVSNTAVCKTSSPASELFFCHVEISWHIL